MSPCRRRHCDDGRSSPVRTSPVGTMKLGFAERCRLWVRRSSPLRRYTGPTAQVQGDWSAARTSRAPLPFGDGPAELSGVILMRVTDGVDSDHTVNGLRSPPQPQRLTRSTADHCFDDGTSCRPSTTAPCIGGIVTPAAASCRHTSKFRSLLNVPAVFRCSVLHTWS